MRSQSLATLASVNPPKALETMPLLLLLPFCFILYKMFTFDAPTEAKLSQLNPVFALRVRALFVLCKQLLGIDFVITSGLRTAAQQLVLHQQDSRNPAPKQGKPDVHMLGLAVDLNGYKNGKVVLLKASSPAAWAPVVSIAKNLLGMRWGGDFSNYYDGNHFDAN